MGVIDKELMSEGGSLKIDMSCGFWGSSYSSFWLVDKKLIWIVGFGFRLLLYVGWLQEIFLFYVFCLNG